MERKVASSNSAADEVFLAIFPLIAIMFVPCTCAYSVLGVQIIIAIVAAFMIGNCSGLFTSEIKASCQYKKKFSGNRVPHVSDSANSIFLPIFKRLTLFPGPPKTSCFFRT